MKITIVGMGQMGRTIERLAEERSMVVHSTFDSDTPLPEEDHLPEGLNDVDVAIDFSIPDVALTHIERYCRWGLPAVIGTTGWYDEIDQVDRWVDDHAATLLYAANFSMGVAVMVRALRGALSLLNNLDEYDAYIHEMHHTNKVDSPSGTAIMLAEEICENLDRKRDISSEVQHGKIPATTLHVSSTRAGKVFGEHVVGFDSQADQVQLKHQAKGRDGFALGALRAAEWLQGRKGLFTLDDVLDDLTD